ncbi:MAG: hypothetical protein GX287_06800 [Fusobacteria bacterium]|nr:hypothetical protein [Fusobacteriota bacterium]
MVIKNNIISKVNISIKTKFLTAAMIAVIVMLTVAYGLTLATVHKNVEKRFDMEIIQKRKLFLYLLDDFSTKVQRESKILSENIFLKNYLTTKNMSEIENGQFITDNIFNDIWNKYSYADFMNELERNIKENFPMDPEINVIVLNEYGFIVDDSRDNDFKKEFSYDFSRDMFQEKIEYFYEKNNLYIRGYSPILSGLRTGYTGGVYVQLKIDDKFLNYFKENLKCDLIMFDPYQEYIASTFSKHTQIDSIKTGLKTNRIDDKFRTFEINDETFKISRIDIFNNLVNKKILNVSRFDKSDNINNDNNKFIGNLYIAVSKLEILKELKKMSIFLFMILFIFFSAVAMVSANVLESIIISIKNLTMKIITLKDGNFQIDFSEFLDRNDEIGVLAKYFEEVLENLQKKLKEIEEVNIENYRNSEKLKKTNKELKTAQEEMERKNLSIFNVNKNLTRRISEISNLYYLIVNMSENIIDDKFYKIIVKGIREGLNIKKVLYYEVKNMECLEIKSKLGSDMPENSKITLTENFFNKIIKNEIYEVVDEKYFEWKDYLQKPYIIPLISSKIKEKNKLYGILILDNELKMYEDIKNAANTYSKMITLACENRELYFKLLKENEKNEKTLDELKQSQAIKNIFISNVNHELKSPLLSIKGYADMMLNHSNLGDISVMQRKALIVMMCSIERLNGIIENLLMYSAYENEKYNFHDNNFNLLESISGALENLETTISKGKIKIHKKYPNSYMNVYGDIEAIKHVIINLLSNSIKFSKENPNIYIDVVETDDKYRIYIKDEGIGIEKEKQKEIFASFKQGDEGDTRTYSGLGLGLAIVKNVLDYYKEELIIKSEFGKGTTVSFSINKNNTNII